MTFKTCVISGSWPRMNWWTFADDSEMNSVSAPGLIWKFASNIRKLCTDMMQEVRQRIRTDVSKKKHAHLPTSTSNNHDVFSLWHILMCEWGRWLSLAVISCSLGGGLKGGFGGIICFLVLEHHQPQHSVSPPVNMLTLNVSSSLCTSPSHCPVLYQSPLPAVVLIFPLVSSGLNLQTSESFSPLCHLSSHPFNSSLCDNWLHSSCRYRV